MPTPVTDMSLTVIRITPERFAKLPEAAREMLRIYPSRAWTEADGTLAYEMATHRVNELITASGLCSLQSAAVSTALTSAEEAVAAMQASGHYGRTHKAD